MAYHYYDSKEDAQAVIDKWLYDEANYERIRQEKQAFIDANPPYIYP